MRDILVPVDGSEGACRAARFAASLAKETGATLTLLHVYDAPTAAALGLTLLPPADVQRMVARLAEGSFDRARKEIVEFGVPVETVAVVGQPGKEIVSQAEQLHPELIVMGTRGLSSLQEVLLGSVSEYVLRHAPCPVALQR